MALEQDIVDWAIGRPPWQREMLSRLATGSPDIDAEAKIIANDLAEGKEIEPHELTPGDLPGGGDAALPVRLESVTPVAHVNALLAGQCLSFSQIGLTVVYGDNASGKSGYARLLKQVVHARHQEDVLTDVFNDGAAATASAVISYRHGQEDPVEDEWPSSANPLLRSVSFYDEACGDAYITRESAVSYRPSTLVLFDQLIALCEAVRQELDRLLATNLQRKAPLPSVPGTTAIFTFLESISDKTTDAEIDEAIRLPDNADKQILKLANEEARLRATDPGRERKRLSDLASHLEQISAHLEKALPELDVAAESKLSQLREQATESRAAAQLASSVSFESEPLSGVGSQTWRALWEASRGYSEAEAYVGQDFPVIADGARCVLCQQSLLDDATGRLHRFHEFMSHDTEQQAKKAQGDLDDALERLRVLNLQPSPIAVAIAAIEQENADLAESCHQALSAFELRRTALILRATEPSTPIPELLPAPTEELQAAAVEATERQSATSDANFVQDINEVASTRAELEGRRVARDGRQQIKGEVARLAERSRLEDAKRFTDTTGITRKSTDLAKDYVTAVILDRFIRESHDLRLQRITLEDVGGKKGQLMQRPALLAATQTAVITNVLSEGEQTALGLAGFLTEAHFDPTKSAIVLDDPVTSLDHIRRGHVASRLCEFAKDRQVIVFTHDVSFVGDLRKAAEAAEVPFTERSVERHGDGSVGMCREVHPWKARDARARLGKLDEELARIKRERSTWDSATYEKEAADWAGSLSETWERIIHIEIVNQVVDRGTSEVRPKMFRMLARITDEDDREFQQSYGRCSKWLRRHDKSPDVNYVPPDVDEMEAELKLVRDWFNRLRKYAD